MVKRGNLFLASTENLSIYLEVNSAHHSFSRQWSVTLSGRLEGPQSVSSKMLCWLCMGQNHCQYKGTQPLDRSYNHHADAQFSCSDQNDPVLLWATPWRLSFRIFKDWRQHARRKTVSGPVITSRFCSNSSKSWARSSSFVVDEL